MYDKVYVKNSFEFGSA